MDIYRVYRVHETDGRVISLDGFLLKQQAIDYAKKLTEIYLDPKAYYAVVKETIPTEVTVSYEPEGRPVTRPYKGGEKMIVLATMLSKDESTEDKVKKQCSNCKWRSYENITQQMICCNYWSENLNSFIDGSDTCEDFELDKNIFSTNHKKYFGKPFKVGG